MSIQNFDEYQNHLSNKNKLGRFLWNITCMILFRPFSLPFFNQWRLFLLRSFGAKIGAGSNVHSSVRIWAPWNLEIGQITGIGPYVECYNPGKIILGNKVTISQRAHLCSASHDYLKKENPLITKPIIIQDYCWVAADSFIAMGVTINEGAIVGARAVVTKDIDSWTVVIGNPAKKLKKRILN
ncbi:MAG: putative colanic acid biosynthesis acetyltransferase [Bacteroidetes bacterium]|nr:putative colanic acid biosynthesis acetyltransferase [Bacteroidota bacterium]